MEILGGRDLVVGSRLPVADLWWLCLLYYFLIFCHGRPILSGSCHHGSSPILPLPCLLHHDGPNSLQDHKPKHMLPPLNYFCQVLCHSDGRSNSYRCHDWYLNQVRECEKSPERRTRIVLKTYCYQRAFLNFWLPTLLLSQKPVMECLGLALPWDP